MSGSLSLFTFSFALGLLANENLKITYSLQQKKKKKKKKWVRAPMRSQFNTKALSNALWVFLPVVEVRWGLESAYWWMPVVVLFLQWHQMAGGAVSNTFC